MFQVQWFPFARVSFDRPEYAPSMFRGIIQVCDVQEPYLPDRVMRQFRHVQGIPALPPQPIAVTRGFNLRHYDVIFHSDLLGVWDEDLRPLIQIEDPSATQYWDVMDDYLDWLDEYSHVLVDPSSTREDRLAGPVHPTPSVDTLAVL